MRKFLAAWAVLALVLSASATAQPVNSERIVSPPLRQFVALRVGTNKLISIRKEVPHGQTLQRWTRMVTTQRFTGFASRMTPDAYARLIAGQLPEACPDVVVSPIVALKVSDRSASQFQIDCPLGEGDQPETALVLVIAGKTDMHVKQISLRGAVPAADLSWARNYLAATVLCEPDDQQDACRGVIPAY